jgi:hypothetical protein
MLGTMLLCEVVMTIETTAYGLTLHDLRCRAASLDLSIVVKGEEELTEEDFGSFFLICEDGYHLAWAFGLPAVSMAVALDCCERDDSDWTAVWESLEPFADSDGVPLRLRRGSAAVQRQYTRRCLQIEKLCS